VHILELMTCSYMPEMTTNLANRWLVPLFILFTVFSLIALGDDAAASEYDFRPDLYLDGGLLADHLAVTLCNDDRSLRFSEYEHKSAVGLALAANHGDKLDSTQNGQTWSEWLGFSKNAAEQKIIDEKSFYDWVQSQPDDSIDPLSFAKKAIEIKGGNVLEGLRFAYNLLTRGVEKSQLFVQRPIFSKLVDITGEYKLVREAYATRVGSRPRKYERIRSTRGGKASAWYHFFGAAAGSFDLGTAVFDQDKPNNFLGNEAYEKAYQIANVMMYLEIANYDSQNYFNDSYKRNSMNWAGVELGARLAQALLNTLTLHDCELWAKVDLPPYLSDRPDIFGEKWRLKGGQMPYEYTYPPELAQKRAGYSPYLLRNVWAPARQTAHAD